MRPVLSPAVRRLWRDPQTMQLGRAPGAAVVLAGLDPGARAVLALLDGTRDLAAVRAAALSRGCPGDRTDELLALLQQAGLVVDADERWPDGLGIGDRDRLRPDVASLGLVHRDGGLAALRRRDRAEVVVVGAGRVGAPLAGLLAAAGVGTVDVVDPGTARARDIGVGGLSPDDVGRRRADAALQRARERAQGLRRGPVAQPDLVVLAPVGSADDGDAALLQRNGVPHLLAEVRDTVGVVGPLVLPGRSACLRCLDLERSERDPGWPAVAAQLSCPGRVPPPCDGPLAAAVSAQAALQVLSLLDGAEPASVGGTLELALPGWRWRRRSWEPHPACDCRWQVVA